MAKQKKTYWTDREENAIVEYQKTQSNDLYKGIIEPAFKELIKNIFFTYNFNKILKDHEMTQHEVLIFLFEKMNNFDASKGYKSFSYFGTVAKRWMLQQRNKVIKNVYIDEADESRLLNNASIKTYITDETDRKNIENLKIVIEKLQLYSNKITLEEEDKRVFEIILAILNNYNTMDIYNKKQLYVLIREATDLPARKITNSLNKIKIVYRQLKEEEIYS